MNIEQVQRIYPAQFNLNLQAKRSKAGDVNFDMPSLNYPYLMELAKRLYSSGYQAGTGTFEYRDPEFRFNTPQIDWSQLLRTQPIRGPQTDSSATSL